MITVFNLTCIPVTKEQDKWLTEHNYEQNEKTPIGKLHDSNVKDYVKNIIDCYWMGSDPDPVAFIIDESNPIFLIHFVKTIQRAISFTEGQEWSSGKVQWNTRRQLGVLPRYLYWINNRYEVIE